MSPLPRRRRDDDEPDVEKAQADLDRARSKRPAVEELVERLKREQRLNHFTANIDATFRGGR